MPRTTTEVIHDHLMKRMEDDLEGDIRDNMRPDVLLLTGYGTYRGHDGVRESARLLSKELAADSKFTYSRTVIEGEYAFLEWTASDANTCIHDGADSFHVIDGRIAMQTCHYTVRSVPETK